MRRFLFLPAVVGITVATLAQSSPPSDSNLTQDPASAPCTVAGRVVAAADGSPVKSARVLLTPEHSHTQNQIYSASSDSDGHFTVHDVPPGRYQFFAFHNGFVEQHYKAGTNETGPIFSLRPGEKFSDALFRLIAAAVIAGRVSNEDGDPMPHVEVVALRRPGEEEIEDDAPRHHKIQMQSVGSAETDDRGQYRIFGLKPGEYFVRAEDSSQPHGGRIVDESYWLKQSLGSEYASVYFPGTTQVSQAQVIPIKAGEEAQVDLAMRRVKTVEITGRLIGAAGPAANAFINLGPADVDESDFNRQDTTDKKGNFHLRNIPEGSYYIRAFQREEGSVVYESRVRQKVEVTGDNIEGLVISLNAGIPIQGKVKIDGSSSIAFDRIQLSLMPVEEGAEPGGFGEVKKDGTFEMKSVYDGNYAIRVWGLESDAYVKSAQRGPDDLLEKGLQVEGGSSGKIEVTISSDGAQLEGSVSDDDGAVIGARVRLVPDPLTPYNRLRMHATMTDQLGHFSVTDIAPGKYKVIAKPMVSSETAAYKSEPQSITLSENDHKTIELKLEKQQE
ncbi:MAG TPA: carboxypeptidase-like regulatory domain-containing protein [Candidatus Sulfotelmatobacter sp.]